jgi:hypothetical protein
MYGSDKLAPSGATALIAKCVAVISCFRIFNLKMDLNVTPKRRLPFSVLKCVILQKVEFHCDIQIHRKFESTSHAISWYVI